MSDVIIVGGGVAGLSAAIFTAKAELNTLVLDDNKAQIERISKVQNIPGIHEGISGTAWISNAKKQVETFGGTIKEETVTDIVKLDDGSFEIKTEQGTYKAKYVVVATNVNKNVLSSFDFEEKTNGLVPNGRAVAIKDVAWNGETKVENLYLAGVIKEIPSQVSVSLGHGVTVGITVASKEKGSPFMWHDL